jgi:hypothetical protein
MSAMPHGVLLDVYKLNFFCVVRRLEADRIVATFCVRGQKRPRLAGYLRLEAFLLTKFGGAF